MTRLIGVRRIGSKATATRRRAPARALAVAFAVLCFGEVYWFAPISVAMAQTAGTAGSITVDLFTDGGVDLNSPAAQPLADAARKAQAPGECPMGRLTIHVPEGDPLFQEALGQARRDAVLLFLDRQGIKVSRFFADVAIGGTQNNVRLDYHMAGDTIAPKLDVQWSPPKGTKVRVGQRITAKVIARDDTDRFQSGIKTIDLNVERGGSFGFGDYPQPQPPCERPPPPRTLEGVYTVPSNPPPLVRLRIVAKDYAGNETEVWADFPTGDWYGTLEFSEEGVTSGVRLAIKDRMDIVLEYDGRGNLTGSLVGNRDFKSIGNPDGCDLEITIPNRLSGKLIGSYTPGAEVMSIQLIEPVAPPPHRKDCPSGGYIISGHSIHEWPPFISVLRGPRASADGTFRASFEETTGAYTNRLSLTLRRAQN